MPTETLTCPLCEHDFTSHNHLRDHLHEEHRKSTIIDALLEHYEG